MRISIRGSRFGLAVILWAANAAAQDFTISTYAGGVPPATPAPALTVPIARVFGVAADTGGNVYFTSDLNCVFKLDTAGVVHLFAGNARWGSTGDGGPATAAQLRDPMGVGVDGMGNVYIAEHSGHRVRRVSPAGIITTVAGTGEQGFSGDGGPATAARLSNPNRVVADGSGNLYIADLGNDRIRRVAPDGTISTVPGATGLPGQADWLDVATDASGNLYVADANDDVLRIVAPNGAITNIPRPAQILYFRAVVVDRTGNLYVSGSDQVLQRVGPAVFTTVAGTGLPGFSGDGGPSTSARMWDPMGLATDSAGNLYIADRFNNRIRRVTMPGGLIVGGTINTVAGDGTGYYSGDGGPAATAQIMPNGVATDGAGNLYIADLHNCRVRRVSPSGIISTYAGSGVCGYGGDGGPATAAKLWAWDVALDTGGNLYIADANNWCVRRVTPGGIITTVAGTCNRMMTPLGDGGPATSAGLGFPTAVVVDAAGNLFISDGEARVRRVSPSGIITTYAGTGQKGYSGDGGLASSAQISSPGGLAVDDAGNLYFADGGNHRIRRVSTSGTITTVGGTGAGGFSGDGGAATSAQLKFPYGVAVDRSGTIYIADNSNHRVRRIVPPISPFHQATINTIAGTGADQYSGDGGPAGAAGLSSPKRLAMDSAGRVYVSTDRAIRMLIPAACAVSATPNVLNAVAAGGPLILTIQAAVGCAWTVTNLPAWIAASVTAGSGPASVTLTVAVNSGPARTATITAAGTVVTINQGAGGGACTYSIAPASWRFTRSASAGTIAVTAPAGCPWTAVTATAWIRITSGAIGAGSGAVNYEITQNTAANMRSGTITVAGMVFTVEQQGTSLDPVAAGSMPHIASGGTWRTTFTLVNNGTTPAMARLSFMDDNGARLTLPVNFPQYGADVVQTALIEPVLDPGATLIAVSEGPASGPPLQGWAQLATDGAVSGFAVFRQAVGEREQEAVVPLEARAAQGYVLAYDNTNNFVTGVAVANLSAQTATVTVIINDEWGRLVQTSPLNVAARGHRAVEVNDLYPATKGKRGTIEFRAPTGGEIGVLGLRFTPKGAFTTVPVMAK